MILFPNCKINLGLHIIRKREDGYHDVETVMVPVPLCDILELIPSCNGTTSLHVTGKRVDCPPEKNLVMKAYRAVEAIFPELPPTEIYLRKIIPDGAGLGGGSADAAFTITGLNSLYNLGMSDTRMEEIAAGIGADCPMFIRNRAMMCTGTGTILEETENPLAGRYIIALAKPAEGVSTKEAYAGVTPFGNRPDIRHILRRPVSEWSGLLLNDFEEGVEKKVPAITDIKKIFSDAGALYVSMTGSGSAVFALFPPENESDAKTALDSLGEYAIGIYFPSKL